MLEYAGSQRAGLRERDAPRLLAVVRSLDWVLLGGRRGARRRGALGRRGRHEVRASRTIRTTTSTARSSTRASAASCSSARRSSIRISIAATGARSIIGTAVVIAFVLLVGHAARGSTRWISLGFFTFQPSEFGKLLFVLALAGMLAERQRAVGDVGDDAEGRRARARARRARLRPARPRHRARLPRGARRDALRRRRAVAAPRRARRIVVVVVVGVLWAGPCGRRQRAQELPAAAPDLLHASVEVSRRRRLQPRPVDHDGRLGPDPGTRPERLDAGQPRLPAGERNRLRLRRLRRAARFVGAALLLGLYLLVLWRGLRVVTVARDLFSAVVAGGIVVALLFQIFVNVGMTMGIAPITGIPLAVRQRRRLVADREPRGDGRAARDPRARPRLALLAPALMPATGLGRGDAASC